MAFATSGVRLVLRSSRRMRSNHSPRWCASRPCSDIRSRACQFAAENLQPRLLGDPPRRLVVAGEVGEVALHEQHLGAVRAVGCLDPVERRRRGRQVAGHQGGAGEPGVQQGAVAGRGVERLAVGADGGLVADREQQVGTNAQQPRAVLAARGPADLLQQLERVAVGADRGLRLGGAQQVRHRLDRLARLHQVVADLGGGGVRGDEPLGDVPVDEAPPMRGHVGQQGVAHEPVAELVAGLGALDGSGCEGRIEVRERLQLVEPARGQEVVGVEDQARAPRPAGGSRASPEGCRRSRSPRRA